MSALHRGAATHGRAFRDVPLKHSASSVPLLLSWVQIKTNFQLLKTHVTKHLPRVAAPRCSPSIDGEEGSGNASAHLLEEVTMGRSESRARFTRPTFGVNPSDICQVPSARGGDEGHTHEKVHVLRKLREFYNLNQFQMRTRREGGQKSKCHFWIALSTHVV